ncbi:MAG: phage tail terminator-like protein [Janthinobacterium lividum]
MSKAIIRELFEARLTAWAAARTPALRIAYENNSFNPITGEVYLRAFVLPGTTFSDDLAGSHRGYVGLYQVSIVVPRNSGNRVSGQIERELDELFPVNLRLTGGLTLQILTPMSGSTAMDDEDTTTIAVRCQYRADTI